MRESHQVEFIPASSEKEPTINLMERLQWLYRMTGSITPAKNSEAGISHPLTVKRQLKILEDKLGYHTDTYNENTRFIKDLKRLPEADRTEMLAQEEKDLNKEKDTIEQQRKNREYLTKMYLNQKEVSIDLSELGRVGARMVDITLPDDQRTEEQKSMSPIFFIPGISNDVECVGSLALETAMQGRRVIVVGYPESFNGNISDEFVNAVEKDAYFEPHAKFYRSALDAIITDGDVEIWGYSTGATIAAKILQEKKYQEKTSR